MSCCAMKGERRAMKGYCARREAYLSSLFLSVMLIMMGILTLHLQHLHNSLMILDELQRSEADFIRECRILETYKCLLAQGETGDFNVDGILITVYASEGGHTLYTEGFAIRTYEKEREMLDIEVFA